MEQPKKELRESKKYRIGSRHLIPSGEIEIMDRFLRDDTNVWLKFLYTDGHKEGRIEEALEKTITTYIFKYNKTREMKKYREIVETQQKEIQNDWQLRTIRTDKVENINKNSKDEQLQEVMKKLNEVLEINQQIMKTNRQLELRVESIADALTAQIKLAQFLNSDPIR